jgi:hypothetical protein
VSLRKKSFATLDIKRRKKHHLQFTKEKVSFPGQMKDILDMEGFRHLTHTVSNLFLKIL